MVLKAKYLRYMESIGIWIPLSISKLVLVCSQAALLGCCLAAFGYKAGLNGSAWVDTLLALMWEELAHPGVTYLETLCSSFHTGYQTRKSLRNYSWEWSSPVSHLIFKPSNFPQIKWIHLSAGHCGFISWTLLGSFFWLLISVREVESKERKMIRPVLPV